MKKNIIFNLFVIIVLGFFGFIVIISTQLSYSTDLTSIISIYYVENLSLTGALNIVVAILLDFRAYDTLGEILVIFVTISGISLLIGRKE
jgi:multisubunit Na+/H+ antiporter MnhB subunit